MACGIYKLTTPSGNFYIGSSCRIAQRWRDHRYRLRNGIHSNSRLDGAFKKYGQLKEEILLICSKEDLIFYEQLCIDAYKPRLNMALIAGRTELTDATKAKISATWTGRKHTDEARAKMSAARKGVKHSPETRAKISASNTGKTHSAETRAKLRRIALVRCNKVLPLL